MSDSTLGLDAPPRRPSSGAHFANWLGTVALILPFVAFVVSQVSYAWCGRSVLLFLSALLVGIVAIVAGLGARLRLQRDPSLSGEGDARRAYLKGFGSLALLFLLVALSPVGSMPPCGERVLSNDASAVGSLRSINTACVTYMNTYPDRGFPRALVHLGPPRPGQSIDAEKAGLIDQILAGGRKTGFVFEYSPGGTDSKGIVTTYSVTARPQEFDKTGFHSFYTDETGIVRLTRENRAATAQDPPLN